MHPGRLFLYFAWGLLLLVLFTADDSVTSSNLSFPLPVPLRSIRILAHCALVPYRIAHFGAEVHSDEVRHRSTVGEPLHAEEEDLGEEEDQLEPPFRALSYLGHFQDEALDLDAAVIAWKQRTSGKHAKSRTTLVVTFKGTESFENWKLDFKLGRIQREDLASFALLLGDIREGNDIEVHSGFSEGVAALQLKGLQVSLRRWMDELDVQHIWFVGHSLGGALATVCAAEFAATMHQESLRTNQRKSRVQLSLFTLGSPRVGNKSFARLVNRTMQHCVRIVHGSDPIVDTPRSVCRIFSGVRSAVVPYKHAAGLVHVSREGRLLAFPTAIELAFVLKSTRWINPQTVLGCYMCFGFQMLDHMIGNYITSISLAERAMRTKELANEENSQQEQTDGLEMQDLLHAQNRRTTASQKTYGTAGSNGRRSTVSWRAFRESIGDVRQLFFGPQATLALPRTSAIVGRNSVVRPHWTFQFGTCALAILTTMMYFTFAYILVIAFICLIGGRNAAAWLMKHGLLYE